MTMTLQLPEEMLPELKKRAAEHGTSEAELVIQYLEKWLSSSVADNAEVLALTRRIIDEDRELLERLA